MVVPQWCSIISNQVTVVLVSVPLFSVAEVRVVVALVCKQDGDQISFSSKSEAT